MPVYAFFDAQSSAILIEGVFSLTRFQFHFLYWDVLGGECVGYNLLK